MNTKLSFIAKRYWGTTAVFLSFFLLILTINTASAATDVVSPTNMQGWGFLQEIGVAQNPGTGQMVMGPAIPPSGTGSAQLTINDPTVGESIGKLMLPGTPLTDLTTLTYDTFRTSSTGNHAVTLQLIVDYDPVPVPSYGRLVFEPSNAGTPPIVDGVWQKWDAQDVNARWWITGLSIGDPCHQSLPCSWANVLGNYPGIQIFPHPDVGGILLKIGSGWAAFDGNVDNLIVGVSGSETIYDFEDTACHNVTRITNHNTIQNAIDNANAHDVIQCEAGTYSENVTINTPVTLRGAGSDCTDATTNTIIQKAANTPVVTLAASGTAVSPLLLQNLCIQAQEVFGIDVPNGSGTVSYVTLDNVSVQGTNPEAGETERGLVVGATATLRNLIVTDSAFDHLAYGWYFHKEVSADSSTVENVTVTNSSFSHNDAKGIYVEKLSDAIFTGGVVEGNGTFTTFWNAAWNGGFDINLKAGSYQNLTLDGMTFTNNGLNTQHGVALMVKGRDDGGTYGAFPATVDNILIQNNTITGNERGIRFGEVGRSNASPTTVTVMRNVINSNTPIYGGGDGSAAGAVIQFSVGDVTVKGNSVSGNPQVFSQNTAGSTLTAYANNITTFTDAGLTSATGTINGRHNWWGTYGSQPTGVDSDSWAYRLGAPVGSWADGSGSATLLDAALTGGSGTAVIISHGRPIIPANAPFGKAIADDIGTNQCSDFYDAFVIGGSGSYTLSIPVDGDAACASGQIGDKLFQFDLIAATGAPNADLCSPDTACWNSITASRTGDMLESLPLDISNLVGTPFVAPSKNSNDPTAVSLLNFTSTTASTGWPYALPLILFVMTGVVYWRQKEKSRSVQR